MGWEVEGVLRQVTSAVVGNKLPTHEKGKYHSSDLIKSQAEINTISGARDLIRTLYMNEVNTPEERRLVEDHLSVLLDRLCVMGLSSIPRSLEINQLHEWSKGPSGHYQHQKLYGEAEVYDGLTRKGTSTQTFS